MFQPKKEERPTGSPGGPCPAMAQLGTLPRKTTGAKQWNRIKRLFFLFFFQNAHLFETKKKIVKSTSFLHHMFHHVLGQCLTILHGVSDWESPQLKALGSSGNARASEVLG